MTANQTVNLGANRFALGLTFNSSGTTTLQGGGANRNLSIGSGGITINSGAGAVSTNATNTERVNFLLTANQTWTNVSSNTFTRGDGTVNLNANTLTVTGSGSATSGRITIQANISGTGSIVKDGTNDLRLSGANTFSGGLTLNSGTIGVFSSATALGAGTFTINGGTLQQANSTAVAYTTNIQVGGAFSLTGTSDAGTLAGTMNLGGTSRSITVSSNWTVSGAISNGSLVKAGGGRLTLSGTNSYTGNTTVSAGSMVLSSTSETSFVIAGNGVNNQINGTAVISLDGSIVFDLSGADATIGNSWLIVDVTSLSETFGSTFSVTGFTDNLDNTWSQTIDAGKKYVFNEGTGILSVATIPEPSTWALLAAGLTFTMVLRRRRGMA